MLEALVVLLVFVVLAFVAMLLRAPEQEVVKAAPPETPTGPPRSARATTVGPPLWVFLLATCAVAAALHYGLGLYPLVAAAAGLVFGVALNILFNALSARRAAAPTSAASTRASARAGGSSYSTWTAGTPRARGGNSATGRTGGT